jgi:hypothetical protein
LFDVGGWRGTDELRERSSRKYKRYEVVMSKLEEWPFLFGRASCLVVNPQIKKITLKKKGTLDSVFPAEDN